MNDKSSAKTGLTKRLGMNRAALLVSAVMVGGVLLFLYQSWSRTGSGQVDVKVPVLSAMGQQGAAAFAENCARCHGDNAGGGSGGPPLVHKIYNPGHHADRAFMLAMQRGVPQHHWRFGNMPPQRHIGKDIAKAIVVYVRELQAANGIVEQPRPMR